MSRKSHNKNPSSLVSIVIPVHRRIDLLKQCVDALPAAFGDIPYEVIIIDNATPIEESREVYSELRKSPNVVIFQSQTNMGFPKACNLGYQKSKSPLLFFLNSDVIMHLMSGDHLVREMDDPKVGVVGMRLLFPETTDLDSQIRPGGKLQHAGLTFRINVEPFHLFMGWTPDHPKIMALREVTAVTGAAMMTRHRLFRDAGLFLTEYGMGTYEDVDYCLKVHSMGYKVIVDVNAVGTHYTGATAEKYGIPYPMQRNHLTFMNRWVDKMMWEEYKFW